MKLTLFLLFLCFLPVTAQQYIPMLEEGNVWSVDLHYEIFDPQPGEPGSFTITYQIAIGETITINNTSYKSIEVDNGSTIECLLREENGIVYQLSQDGSTEKILFDYTLEEGDVFSLNESAYSDYYICLGLGGQTWEPYLNVQNVDYLFIAGQNRKVITFEEYGGMIMNFQWIEGIGNITGFSLMWEQIDVTAGSLLVCFTQNNQTTFFNDAISCDNTTLSLQNYNTQNFVLSPNPVKQTSQILLPPNSSGYTIKIFDLNGKVLNESQHQKDIFIINATDFDTGLYFYQVFKESKRLKTERFLVK